jgi:glutamate-1-semialdehyde 2,1-aminomutase
MNISQSKAAFKEALKCMPGGVNSPVRSFRSTGGDPLFIQKASGAYITDIDGNEFIDYVGSWGPMILGHAHSRVLDSLWETMKNGTSFGAPTLLETKLANLIISLMPSIEMVRMVNSGTEATMSALRLARGYTRRDLIIKFEGCYHGHADSFLIQAGSGALTHSQPNSPGVTAGTANDTLLAKFNDLGSVIRLFEKHGKKIAAVILEPIPGNMGVIQPEKAFIQGIEELCKQYRSLLIFDEVMTGFRVSKGGAQELYNVKPDLTTLGKIIGGGLPVGAYGGKKEIMEYLSPKGPVYQAGTLSGNPLAMAAGYSTLMQIGEHHSFYDDLERKGAALEEGLCKAAESTKIKIKINRAGSMFTVFFTERETVTSLDDVNSCNTKMFSEFFRLSLAGGIYLAPSQFEAGFISAAHTMDDIQQTIEKSYESFEQIGSHQIRN